MSLSQQLLATQLQLVLCLALLAWSAQGLEPASSRPAISHKDRRLPLAPPKFPKAPGDSKPRCYRAACSARLPRNTYGLPKVIHQTVADRRRAPCTAVAHMQTWLLRNPDYHYWLHDDQDCRRLVQYNFPYLLEYYDSLLTPVERSDLWRYLVLYVHGGVYADIDVSCELPVDEWDGAYASLPHTSHPDTPRVWVGLESNYTSLAQAYATKHMFPLQMTQWTIAAQPGHPLLGSMGLRSMAEAARQFLLLNRYVAAATPQDTAPIDKPRRKRRFQEVQHRLEGVSGATPGAAAASKPGQQRQAAQGQPAAAAGHPGQGVQTVASTGQQARVWHAQQQQQQQQHMELQPSRASGPSTTVVAERQSSQAAATDGYMTPAVRRLRQALQDVGAGAPHPRPSTAAMDVAAGGAAGGVGAPTEQAPQQAPAAGTLGPAASKDTASRATNGTHKAGGMAAGPLPTAAASQGAPGSSSSSSSAAAGAAGANISSVVSLLPGLFQPSLVPTATGVSFDYQGTILNRTGPFLWTTAVLEFIAGVASQGGEGDTWGPLVAASAGLRPSKAAAEEDWEEGEGAAGAGLAQPSAAQQQLLAKHVRVQAHAAASRQHTMPLPHQRRQLHQQQQQQQQQQLQPVELASSQEWLQLLEAAGGAAAASGNSQVWTAQQQQQQQPLALCSGWVAALMPKGSCAASRQAQQLQIQWQQIQQQGPVYAAAADQLRQLWHGAPGAGADRVAARPAGAARTLTTARAFIGYDVITTDATHPAQQQQQQQEEAQQGGPGATAAAAPAPADDATPGATGSTKASAAVGEGTPAATPGAETPATAAVTAAAGAAVEGASTAPGGLHSAAHEAAASGAQSADQQAEAQHKGEPPVEAAPAPLEEGTGVANPEDAVAVRATQHLVMGAWAGDLKLLPINAFAAGQPDSAWAAEAPGKELVRHHFMGSWKKHLKKAWQQPAAVEMHAEVVQGEVGAAVGAEEGADASIAAAAGHVEQPLDGVGQAAQDGTQLDAGAQGQHHTTAASSSSQDVHGEGVSSTVTSSSGGGYRRMLRQFPIQQRPGGFQAGAGMGMGMGMGMGGGFGHNPFVSRTHTNPGLPAATMWARQNGVAVNTHPWAVWRPMVSNSGGGITMQANMRVAAGWTLLQRLAMLGEGRRLRRVCVWGEQWE